MTIDSKISARFEQHDPDIVHLGQPNARTVLSQLRSMAHRQVF